MQHLDEGILHELLDGEIPSSDLPPIQAHLAACSECRGRLEEARELAGEAERLIETIELPEAGAPRPVDLPPRIRPRAWGRDLAWAATVVVAVGAGYLARGGAADRPALTDSLASAPAPQAATPVVTAPQEGFTPAGADQPRAAEQERPQQGAKVGASTASEPAREAKARGRTGAGPDTAAKPGSAPDDARLALEETRAADKSAPLADARGARKDGVPAPATPPSLGAASSRLMRQERNAAANEVRLDELGKLSFALKREAAPVEINFTEARRMLRDSLRLIEGLVPERLEALGAEVRVVYALGSGELVLEQWLQEGRINYRLVAPQDFPVDSLKRLRALVRE